ncbi:WbuC family cupin fold metalloprotein [Candidatus Pelagibacter sp.]|jgi:cupin fold WbuC family metalloprotein|nr:WbuC family cupin fold metalloprotein [Candidatus Pelagibacter sp.]
MNFKIQNIKVNGKNVAKVFKYQKKKFKGINFFTSKFDNFQVGLMVHPKNHIIKPHFHLNKKKTIKHMSELLILFSGKLKVFFYNKNKSRARSVTLNKKDMVLLMSGGHGFKVIENVEMLEVKQGPFFGDNDKIRLENI